MTAKRTKPPGDHDTVLYQYRKQWDKTYGSAGLLPEMTSTLLLWASKGATVSFGLDKAAFLERIVRKGALTEVEAKGLLAHLIRRRVLSETSHFVLGRSGLTKLPSTLIIWSN